MLHYPASPHLMPAGHVSVHPAVSGMTPPYRAEPIMAQGLDVDPDTASVQGVLTGGATLFAIVRITDAEEQQAVGTIVIQCGEEKNKR